MHNFTRDENGHVLGTYRIHLRNPITLDGFGHAIVDGVSAEMPGSDAARICAALGSEVDRVEPCIVETAEEKSARELREAEERERAARESDRVGPTAEELAAKAKREAEERAEEEAKAAKAERKRLREELFASIAARIETGELGIDAATTELPNDLHGPFAKYLARRAKAAAEAAKETKAT